MNSHGIKIASTLTGLSSHVIRVWEKRYAAVTPQRTDTNRRLYTDADISRLQNLSRLVKSGHAISHIAHLKDSELQALLASMPSSVADSIEEEPADKTDRLIRAAVVAVKKYDQNALDRVFDEASLELSYSGLLEQVVIPVIIQVGDDWQNGNLTSASEHAATSFIKDYLTRSVRSYTPEEHAPTLVVTTPAGQLHELGAFIGSCQARKSGWKTVYLGPSLLADDIAGAVTHADATALLLSIVYPVDDPQLPDELNRLRKQCPENLPILVGGSGVESYHKSLADIDAITIASLSALSPELQKIRKSRLKSTKLSPSKHS